MNEIIAFCGLACHECGAFLATRNDDDEKRREVAEIWSRQFDANIKPQDINCEGCLTDGGNCFSYCEVCEIRKCGKEKEIENCGYCNDYVCDKLEKFFHTVPGSRKRLDRIRSGG